MSNAQSTFPPGAWLIRGSATGDLNDWAPLGHHFAAGPAIELPCPISKVTLSLCDLPSVSPSADSCFLFETFRLIPTQRLLLDGERPVPIGARAMDLLIALTQKAGNVLGKQELMRHVWPGVTVEESNLKVQISVLRRVLGDQHAGRRYIVTVPGRGYTFVAQVTREIIARIDSVLPHQR
jgi:DNA-binding winged helix-turn-helix (wHTH) protein